MNGPWMTHEWPGGCGKPCRPVGGLETWAMRRCPGPCAADVAQRRGSGSGGATPGWRDNALACTRAAALGACPSPAAHPPSVKNADKRFGPRLGSAYSPRRQKMLMNINHLGGRRRAVKLIQPSGQFSADVSSAAAIDSQSTARLLLRCAHRAYFGACVQRPARCLTLTNFLSG